MNRREFIRQGTLYVLGLFPVLAWIIKKFTPRKKLKSTFSFEKLEDLRIYHGVDLENELIEVMANEIRSGTKSYI